MFAQTRRLENNAGSLVFGMNHTASVAKKTSMKNTMPMWMATLLYLITPEDSSDTTYREPVSRYLQAIPRYAQDLKPMFWIGMAIVTSIVISSL